MMWTSDHAMAASTLENLVPIFQEWCGSTMNSVRVSVGEMKIVSWKFALLHYCWKSGVKSFSVDKTILLSRMASTNFTVIFSGFESRPLDTKPTAPQVAVIATS